MVIGVPKEIYPGERRVSLVPAVIPNLAKAGLEVVVQSGAGVEAGYPDADFEAKGAKILPDRAQVFGKADLILQVLCYGANDINGADDLPLLRPGQVLIGFMRPLGSVDIVRQIAGAGVAAFTFELMPRITRAQNMDALSSMATVSGYKAVLLAADRLPRMLPMLTTAAGTITPARVLVIGAGVAGLQAIATAHRLGAITSGYDVRPAAREQILSLGARVVELELETGEEAEDKRGYAKAQDEAFYERQREQLGRVVSESDVVITTAVVPGRRPPLLVTGDAVRRMSPGSVVVDMAAERGGNCELTRSGEVIVDHGVTLVGYFNLASTVPYHASFMYARNATVFLTHLVKDGKIDLDRDDEILRETLLTRGNEIVQSRVREFFNLPAPQKT